MLENEYDITARHCLSTNNPDTMDELDNLPKILSGLCDMVGMVRETDAVEKLHT